MFTFLLVVAFTLLGFAAGMLVMRKHHKTLSDTELKTKVLLDALKK